MHHHLRRVSVRVPVSTVLSAFLLVAVTPQFTMGEEHDLFPFVLSYECPNNVTNVSSWLDRPAGKHGRVRVEDGHFVTDNGPLRLWATNLCFDACFPSHDQAERLAARLARFGINCVRMHHMDSRSIWGDSPDKTTIDPKQLDRLDYLIHQLKQHGIYTNINLHVSRWLGPKEGFVAREQRPNYDKGLGNFEPRMIELQRKYARDLLTHVNPNTHFDYAHDPAVAFVEISNEDALFTVWKWGDLDTLPEPYATTFRERWNAWLRQKYGTTERLRQDWNIEASPLGAQLLTNGDFSKPLGSRWNMERDEQTEVEWSVSDDGPNGQPALTVVVTRQGAESWRPQFTNTGFAVKGDSPVTLQFWMRSDKPQEIGVNCMMAHDPWQQLGLAVNAKTQPEWKRYRFTFIASQKDEKARITFTHLKPGTYQLADVSLRPGGISGLEPGQAIETNTVPVLRFGAMQWTRKVQEDFIDFLWETEKAYWGGMYRFLKESLDVQSLVSGTQLSYSPVHIQSSLDYIDAHSYWQHPRFPGRPWDSRNWYVNNVALVNSPGGTLASLAGRRVAGLPYTVSEYNHPSPNAYNAEGFPMIAAMAAFHSWDGVFSFAYAHNTDFEPRRIGSYFDIKSHTAKLVHHPACVALFVRGDVAPAETTLKAVLSLDAERQKLYETHNVRSLTAEHFGLDSSLALTHGIALDTATSATSKPDFVATSSSQSKYDSDTAQLRWDVSSPEAGYFVADTPRTKLFTGFVRGRQFQLGKVGLEFGSTRLDWATVSLTCIDGAGFQAPGRILIAATGWIQNSGAELEDLGQGRVTLSNRWGREPILCEGIPARIELPVAAARVRLYPLDEAGNRRDAIPVTGSADHAQLQLGPQHRTVWYEVEIKTR
ncbi:MAG: carbohydrate binding domain-containing protein [Pirellulaceae bacterium]